MKELVKPNPLNRSLLVALRKARHASGLSQVKLAAEVGINHVTLSRIELGQTVPSINLYHKMFDKLGVQIQVGVRND